MQNQEQKMFEEIDSYGGNKLLNSSPDDLADYFHEKYSIEPLELHTESIVVEVLDSKVDVSRDQSRDIRDRSKPFYIPGTQTVAELPFSGEKDLFYCQGSRFSTNPPRGEIRGNLVKLTLSSVKPDAEATRNSINSWITRLQNQVTWLREELVPWNASLRGKARQRIDFKRDKLLADKKFSADLGFPLKKRAGAISTYVPPEIRRKPVPTPLPASTKPYEHEPALSAEQYEHILGIIQKTAVMLERSPHAFRGMGEEQLRDQFLVPLNSHYEGQATGETFNLGGKTDILVRVKDKCVFIAECKVWRGPKGLSEAIDQLLGYTTWRDTKTAILVFNRNRNLSAVIEQIPSIFKEHPSFKRQSSYKAESAFRFVIANRDDSNREITVTVMVFDVPQLPDKS